jgi:hypothetical protein
VGGDGFHVNVNVILIIGVFSKGGKRILHVSVLAAVFAMALRQRLYASWMNGFKLIQILLAGIL